MTVESETYRNQYNCDGSQTVFPYTFKILHESHLRVVLADSGGNETVLTLNTDYTVSGVGDASGGNVTTVNTYGSGYTLTIIRDVPITQTTDYVENDPFPAESHEDALDKLTMIMQQLAEALGRAPKVAVSSALSDLVLPVAAGRAIAWDDDGDSLTTVAAGNVVDPAWDSLSNYNNSLPAMVSAVGSSKKTVLIHSSPAELTADLEIPDNIHLVWLKGCPVCIASGKTLTINGTLEAGRYQIFGGGGSVSFGDLISEAYPEWWGVDGTADEIEINKAINALSRGVVWLTQDEYNTAGDIELKEQVRLASKAFSAGSTQTGVSPVTIKPGTGVTYTIKLDDLRGAEVSNINIDFTNAPSTCYGIAVFQSWFNEFKNIGIMNLSESGHVGVIQKYGDTYGPYWNKYENVTIRDSADPELGNSTGFLLEGQDGQRLNNTTLINCQVYHCDYGFKILHPTSVIMINCQAEWPKSVGVYIHRANTLASPLIIGGEYNGGDYNISGKATIIGANLNNSNIDSTNRGALFIRHENFRSEETLDFTSGGTYSPSEGDQITGDTSGATATIRKIQRFVGTFSGGDAAGRFFISDRNGTFQDGETLTINGNSNAATVSGTVQDDTAAILRMNTPLDFRKPFAWETTEQTITAASDQIVASTPFIELHTDSSDITLTSTPHIVPPDGGYFWDGQIIVFFNPTSGGKDVTFQDNGALSGSGVRLRNGDTFELNYYSAICFRYDGEDRLWKELWRSKRSNVTYTVNNVTTDRSFDADSTTLDEIADVLGTLIGDLQNLGLLK